MGLIVMKLAQLIKKLIKIGLSTFLNNIFEIIYILK